MKDCDLRHLFLRQFYNHKDVGLIGLGEVPKNCATLKIPEGEKKETALRICQQLLKDDLITFRQQGRPERGRRSEFLFGFGRITGKGSALIEGTDQSPSIIHNDHSQTVIVKDSTGTQIAGANSHQQQTVTHHVEQLIREIDAAPVSAEEKTEAKSRLAAFLDTKTSDAIFGAGTAALLKLLGL